MSDQNRDTSNNRTINKNPLLLSSVTGLTFDDFTNKAIILPAAALPPKLPEPKDIKDTEPTKPVIFGSETAILDTESFSEISLDRPSDSETYPLLANPLQDDQFNTEYQKTFNPLTQATNLTASLSQLPSVASSVFSSFSSILRGNSPIPNASNDQQQQQQQIDSYNAFPAQAFGDVPLINSSLSYQSEESAVPAVAPTFYSTNDPAFLPPAPAFSPPPANTSSGNAYRLTTKRKIYAPAPGLTHQENQAALGAFPSHAPPLPHPISEQNFQVNQSAAYQNTAVNQEPPSQSNKFSLTSFFSTPLLEKITGSGISQQTPAADVPEVFAVQSISPQAPIVTPGLFDTHPVPESLPNFFSPEQQTFQPTPPSTAQLFFNPAQQTNLPTVNQTQPSLYGGTTESVPNVAPIPPSTIPPSSGNVSNYRLRGKPHYKNPLASTITPSVIPFPQVTSSPVGIFNPVNLHTSSDQQGQSISSTVNPSQSIDSSGFPQQLPPNVAFFNQPPSVPSEPNTLIFNPFNSNTSGSAPPGNDFPSTNFDPFTRRNEFQPPIQVPQLSQTQGIQLPTERQQIQPPPLQPQPFQIQPCQLPPSQFYPNQPQVVEVPAIQQPIGVIPPVQDTEHTGYVQPSAPVYNPIVLLEEQAQLPPILPSAGAAVLTDRSHQTAQLQSDIFQQQEPVNESSQFQQLFPQQPPQLQHPFEVEQQGTELQATPLQPPYFDNPFAVPTSHSENQSSFASDIFSQFQPQNQASDSYSAQPFSTGSAALDPYSQEVSQSLGQNTVPQYTEDILVDTQAQLSNLNLNQEQSSGEAGLLFSSSNLHQDNTDAKSLNQQTDSQNSSTFDNFFNQQTSQQSENLSYPEPPLPEPVASSTLASTFFATPTNSSQTDWFNSPKTLEASTNQFQGDINKNTQAPTETETIDASSFFATNNNQTASPPNYFQIQNFFNNPPLISDSKEQDNNFNFIENNLINKRLHNLTHKASTETDGGSISSNIVEPPSSAQSEFSEFAEVNPETAQSDEYVGEQQFPVDSPNTTTNMANTTDQLNGGPAAAVTEISNVVYRPVYKHWFFNKNSSDPKPAWTPFPMNDSLSLEDAFVSNSNECITTNGGRYDVNIESRLRSPIYWNGASDEVRRCSWFYKGADSRLVPYEESVSDLLEEEYRLTSQSGEWNRRIVIPSGEVVMFQGPSIMVHFLAAQTPDVWPNASVPPTANRPRVVKRGVDEFDIEDGEPEQVNHLLFMVHGIGAGCDLKFRSVEEVVEDFRAIALQLTQSHYRSSCDRGEVGRIEILPVSWHVELHSDESGIDEKLKAITLESIPKLRTFTNETLLDILFYSSPVFCQKIMDTVAGTINNMYAKYCERNPNFKGNVSLAGHSLGSLILFDLLQNQRGSQCFDNQLAEDCSSAPETNEEVAGVRSHKPLSRTRSRKINYTIGPAGTGQPYIKYPQLVFAPKKFFALGSPIGMFVTVRGIDNLGLDYKLPTTDGFYNIFHPYDPVAYRIEALVNSELMPVRPVLIPHHKGRKRMHLELRETMARVGADIKQKIIDTFKSVYNFASLQKNDPKMLQQEVDKVLEEQLALESSQPQRARACSTSTTSSDTDNGETEFSLGMLNEGKRIDYVLQEAPLEFFNEYLFALTSHVCYWDSADTILFIVKEVYTSLGIQTDNQIPQQSMRIERPISTPTSPAPTDS